MKTDWDGLIIALMFTIPFCILVYGMIKQSEYEKERLDNAVQVILESTRDCK